LSDDGSLAVFDSPDGSLIPGDGNRRSDIFARNLATETTELVSVHDPALPSQPPNGISTICSSSASADGRYAVFASDGDNLVPNDTNGTWDVFVRDLSLGTNLLVSANTNGNVASGLSGEPAISGNGRYVAFSSYASDLVAGDTNNAQDVFVRDLVSGSTTLVSINTAGNGPGNKASYTPAISADGRYVLFRSKAGNLAGGSFSGTDNLFLRDLQTSTTYALTTAGVAFASMTPDGRFVALVDAAGASTGKIYLWGTFPAARVATNSTSAGILAISISPDGNRIACFAGSGTPSLSVLDQAASTSWVAGTGFPGLHTGLRFSANGRFLAYAASATANGTNQVYLHDGQTQTTILLSQSTNAPAAGDGFADSPDISADGRFVAYRSGADNLVPGDNNGVPDVFLYDQRQSTTTLLSGNGNSSANNRSLIPVFSGNGRTLLFQSWASDLAANDFNQSSDLFAFVFLYASIAPGAGPGAGPTISWPAVPGQSYHVQFKNNLGDNNWQEVAGTVTITENLGYLTDPAPDANNRFYRIVAY
jgi:Tol biopolymer transport system component